MTPALRTRIHRTLICDVEFIKRRLTTAGSHEERRMLMAALATTRESIAMVAR